MKLDPDDLTALVATAHAVTDITKSGVGVMKFLQMLRSQLGRNLFRKSAQQKRDERLEEVRTEIDAGMMKLDGEYDQKEHKAEREARLRRFKQGLKAADRPIPQDDLEVLEVIFDATETEAPQDQSPQQYVEDRQRESIKEFARQTVNALGQHPNISPDPVDSAVASRIVNTVKDITDDEARQRWALLMAEETAQPGTFSLRTLDVLRNLSNDEAKHFAQVCRCCTREGQIIIIPGYPAHTREALAIDNGYIRKAGLGYTVFSALEECGLVRESMFNLPIDTPNRFDFGTRIFRISVVGVHFALGNIPLVPQQFPLGGYVLTQAGQQLRSLTGATPNEDYLTHLVLKEAIGAAPAPDRNEAWPRWANGREKPIRQPSVVSEEMCAASAAAEVKEDPPGPQCVEWTTLQKASRRRKKTGRLGRQASKRTMSCRPRRRIWAGIRMKAF